MQPESTPEAQDLSVSGESGTVLLRGGLIADVESRRLIRGDIAIEGGRIREVFAADDNRGAPASMIDVRGCVIVPGLVNAHTHSYAPLGRHVGPGLPLEPWMMHSWANTIGRTPEETYLSAILQGIEALTTGTTTLLDHLGGDISVMSAALKAYDDLGIRAVLAPMVTDMVLPETVGVPTEEWPAGARARDGVFIRSDAADLLAMTEDLHTEWHGHADRLSVFLGPSGPQRCSISMLEQVAQLADKLDVGVHTHLLETRAQAAIPVPAGERSWVRTLASAGLLTPRLSVAHGVWLSEQDMRELSAAGVSIVHNPQSNLQLGSGIGQLHRWRRHRLPVALGTDGVNCGGSMDMLSSMRLAAILHRPGLADPRDWESPWSVLDSATRGGAQALSVTDIGNVRPGMRADLSAFEMSGTAFATHEDPIASLVLTSYDHRARIVMVGGRTVVRDGIVQTVDVEAAIEQAAEMHAHLMARNSRYADVARAQEKFLTKISGAATPNRDMMAFSAPQEGDVSE